MPVTINISQTIKPIARDSKTKRTTPLEIFDRIWGTKGDNAYEELLQSTFDFRPESQVEPDIQIHDNGFIETVVDAYNRHHNLIFKPDDIWIAILTQFNFYVNAHSEELRTKFVAHEGKKKLTVGGVGSRFSVDFGRLAAAFTEKIQENVVDPELEKWILPDFSTTTFNDTVICSVLMMATLKSYFDYGISLMCGIPNVTLLGEKEDWQKLLARVDKLDSFGSEPAAWGCLLRPVLSKFVDAFDGDFHPGFWSNICDVEEFGSGSPDLSGWITAFCVWTCEGHWIGPNLPLQPKENASFFEHVISMEILPRAICEVDVDLDDNGEKFDCVMVAGHIGSETVEPSRDTLALLPAWFMGIKKKN